MMDQGLQPRTHPERAGLEEAPTGGQQAERRARRLREAKEVERSFIHFFNSRYGWSDSLLDCLTIAGIGTRLARGWAGMALHEQLIFSVYIVVVVLHAAWRLLGPRSYCRWRHLSGTALALFATCAPWFWRRRLAGLARRPAPPPPPRAGSGQLQSVVVAARVALVSSYCLQLTVYGMSRPAPLYLKAPAHALATAAALAHVPAMCRTPTFAQPAVALWFGRAFRALRSAAAALPLPASPYLPEPSEEAACTAVTSFLLLLLGCILPLSVTAAAEVRAREQHAQLHGQYWRHWRRQRRRPWWRFASWLASGSRLFPLRAADAAAFTLAAAALWDMLVAGLSTAGAEQPAAAPP